MTGEARLQGLCADRLRAYVDQQGYDDAKIGEQTQTIKDCAIVPENGEFTLVMGHAEADVALYKTDEDLTEHMEEDSKFKLYQNADNGFRVPLIILETKSSDLTTDKVETGTSSLEKRRNHSRLRRTQQFPPAPNFARAISQSRWVATLNAGRSTGTG